MEGFGGLNLQEYIDFLQRYIIVHSYIYYEMDENLISDRDYDAAAKKLVQLKTDYPLLWINSEYHKQFGDDYNGSTGFTLYHELSDRQKEIIQSIIHNIFRKGD